MEAVIEDETINLLYAKLGDLSHLMPSEQDIKNLLPQMGLEAQFIDLWGNSRTGMILIAIFLAARLDQYERET